MAAPEHTPLGARLVERTAPLGTADEEHNWAHALLCEAMMRPAEQVAELVDPAGDLSPWEPLFDPYLAPAWALRWLSMAVGVVIPSGLSEAEQRDSIAALAGKTPGSPSGLRALAQIFLTGNRTVWFRERDGSAYQLEIVTRTAETPDEDRVEAILRANKPAGLVLDYRTVAGWDYQQLKTEFTGQTYADLNAAFATYRDLRENA